MLWRNPLPNLALLAFYLSLCDNEYAIMFSDAYSVIRVFGMVDSGSDSAELSLGVPIFVPRFGD